MLAHLAAEFELSEREKEALTCMDGGMTNAQIAENMGISLSTVKKHVYHIFEKVGVDTRAQLRNVLETYNSTKFYKSSNYTEKNAYKVQLSHYFSDATISA